MAQRMGDRHDKRVGMQASKDIGMYIWGKGD